MGYGARQGAPKPCSSRNSECDLLWKQRCCLYKQVGMKTPRTIVAQLVKKPPAMQETSVRSLGWEDPLAKGKATHSSILAWRIPWTTVHGVAKSRTRLKDSHFHPGSRRTQIQSWCPSKKKETWTWRHTQREGGERHRDSGDTAVWSRRQRLEQGVHKPGLLGRHGKASPRDSRSQPCQPLESGLLSCFQLPSLWCSQS